MKYTLPDGEYSMSQRPLASQVESRVLPATAERRRAVRFRCRSRNAWRLFAATTNSGGDGIVNDISLTGISLLVAAPVRPGMFLELSRVNEGEPSPSQPMLVRVRRATRQADGNWLIGCSFVKTLTQSQVSAWL